MRSLSYRQLVINEIDNDQTTSNIRLNTGSLKSGIYIMRISQDNPIITKKLVIK